MELLILCAMQKNLHMQTLNVRWLVSSAEVKPSSEAPAAGVSISKDARGLVPLSGMGMGGCCRVQVFRMVC